jgi:hypothetical protein
MLVMGLAGLVVHRQLRAAQAPDAHYTGLPAGPVEGQAEDARASAAPMRRAKRSKAAWGPVALEMCLLAPGTPPAHGAPVVDTVPGAAQGTV